jgi:hypothetical protein
LGDKVHDFSLETTNRVRSFGMKLERKRNYEKFTMPTTDCDEIMIIFNCLVSFSIANTICCFSYSEVIKYILNRVRSNNVEFTALLHDQLGFNSFMQMIVIMSFD